MEILEFLGIVRFLVLSLAVAGLAFSAIAAKCVSLHITNPEDARFRTTIVWTTFGLAPKETNIDVHWAQIGMAGYVLIMLTMMFPVVNTILIIIAGLTTIWLAWKAWKIRLGCFVCPLIWVINGLLVVTLFL